MYFYVRLKRGKVNLTDVYNASVNYDIPNTHKNNLHMVLYKMVDVAQGVALPNVTLKERYKRMV
jgi:hypothetical protein